MTAGATTAGRPRPIEAKVCCANIAPSASSSRRNWRSMAMAELPKPHPSFSWAWHSPRGGCRLTGIDEGSGENTFSPAFAYLSDRAAHQLAGQRTGRLAMPVGHGAGDDGGVVATHRLHQPPPAAGQVVEHPRPVQR